MNVARGIELGHVFQLGRKYAEAFGLTVSDADGRPVTLTMGSYGIGISRAVAALAEQTHDSLGLRWPRRVAPADLHLVATGRGDEAFEVADELALRLAQRGVRVLYDDRRGSSAGVKFADAELLGLPRIVIVGRGLADGMIEVRDRSTGETRQVALVDAPDLLANHND